MKIKVKSIEEIVKIFEERENELDAYDIKEWSANYCDKEFEVSRIKAGIFRGFYETKTGDIFARDEFKVVEG